MATTPDGDGDDTSACEHTSLSSFETVKTATCTQDGEKSRHCLAEGCDYVETVKIPKLGHALKTQPAKEATCTEEGLTSYETCSRCSYATTPTVIDKLEHIPSKAWKNGPAPTCYQDGERYKVCTVCDTVVETEVRPATGKHTFGAWNETLAPTCTENGSKTRGCTTDGCTHTETVTIDALGHDMDDGVVTANPTCTEAGVKTFTCQRDFGHTETEDIDALGHSGDDMVVEIYPTCTETGLQHGVCGVCGETLEDDVIPALGHDMDDGVVTTNPTCTEAGVKTFTCQRDCGHTETEAVDALGHDIDDGVVTTNPTCTEAGVKTFTCQRDCGHTETEVVSALGHELEDVEGKDATCTEAGYTAYKDCARCDYTDGKTAIYALGHDMGDLIETAPPTCSAPGVMTATCKRGCGYTETEQTNVLAHRVGAWRFTTDGARERVCSGCDYKEIDYVISFGNGQLVSNDKITFTPGPITQAGTDAGESAPAPITAGASSGGNTNTKLEIRNDIAGKIGKLVLYVNNNPAKSSYFDHTSATVKLTGGDATGDFYVFEFDYKGITRTNSGAEPMFQILFGGNTDNPLNFYPKYGKEANYGTGMGFGIGGRNILNSSYEYNAETDTSTVLPPDEWNTVRLVLKAPRNGADGDYKLYTYVKSSVTGDRLTLVATTTAEGTSVSSNGISKSSAAALNVTSLKTASPTTVKISFYNSSKSQGTASSEYAIDNISFMRMESLECPHTNISDWSVSVEPTADAQGMKTRVCLEEGCDFVETAPIPQNLIFNESVEQLVVIYDGNDISDELKSRLNDVIFSTVGSSFSYENEAPIEIAKHEIIIGRSQRAVSVKAYELLDSLMRGEGESKGGYVIYSDGSSLAAAYTEEYTDHIKKFVIEYLSELCCTDELTAPQGVLKQECVDLYEIYAEEDAEWREKEWSAFEAEMGTEITEAFKYLYGMYSSDVIEWLANLYEPRVCVCNTYDENGIRICQFPKDENGNYICKNGGFYYSTTAKEIYGFGVDIESTIQALGIIERAGLTREFGGSYVNALPAQIKADIVAFIKSCQNENGFFYHPQWTKEDTDAQLGRRGRDLMWAQSLLQKFGAKPFYDTPGGMSGEGAPTPVASPAALTARLKTSTIVAVASVRSASEPVAEHLVSAEAFKAYLDTLPINTYSYSVGNQLAAQSVQLVNRDKQLNGEISKVLFEWTNSHQNPENGLWEPQINHSSVNGLFKILTFYNDFKQPFPYAYEAACAAIQVISSDEVPAHVCSIYNAWWDVGALLKNMELYNTSYTPEQRAEIRQSVLSIAAQGIRDTRDWYEVFEKGGGAFSYTPPYASSTSQGMPVTLPKTAEGDVNATEICLNGLRNHAVYALGASVTPDLFGTLEMVKFLTIIENATPTVKRDIPDAETNDFDDYTVGTLPEIVGGNVVDYEFGLLNSGGCAVITDAPDTRVGKVLHITHLANSGKGDDLTVANIGRTRNTSCTVLDVDMYIASEGTSQNASIAQFTVGTAYMFFMQSTSDGKIKLWEGSSFTFGKSKDRLLATLDMDDWFNIRIEYYPDTAKDVRIKLYIDGELLIVSENYFDNSGTKFDGGDAAPVDNGKKCRLRGHSSYNMNLYLDNPYIGCQEKEYKSEASTVGLVYNADKTGGDRVTHTFDGTEMPGGITEDDEKGKFTVEGGALKLNAVSGTSTITVPVNVRCGIGNVYSFGFDIKLGSAIAEGDTISVVFNVPYAQYGVKNIMEITFKVIKLDGRMSLVPTNNGGTEVFTSAAVFVGGESVSIELALFKDKTTALIYADGVYVGSTEYFKITSIYKPYHYDFSSVSFIYKGNVDAALDNVFAEIRLGDYATEIAESPDDTASVITYEYSKTESLPKRLTTSLKTEGGAAVIELMERDGVSGNVLHLTTSAGDADQVNFNLTPDGKAGANKLVFATDVMFALDVEKDGVTSYSFEIFFLGANNEIASKNVFSQRNTGVVAMQDYSNNSGAIIGPSTVIGNSNEWLRLRIEIDMGDGTKDTLSYKTYVNDTLVYDSNNYWQCEGGDPCAITEIAKIRFSTYNKSQGSIYFDNTSILAPEGPSAQ